MGNEPIILFDGICNFCNSAINFTIKRDKKKQIKFAPLQSEAGQKLLKEYKLPVNEFESFVFIVNNKVFTKSTAALTVCKYLKGAWPLCYSFILVPGFIRNAVYDLVARNRYKWFGSKDTCMIPTPDIRARFLTD